MNMIWFVTVLIAVSVISCRYFNYELSESMFWSLPVWFMHKWEIASRVLEDLGQ